MCFPAGASFAAGSVLIPAGLCCIRRGMACNRNWLWLAAVAAATFAASATVYLPLLLDAGASLRVDVAFHSIRYQFESLFGVRGMPRALWQFACVAIVTLPFLAPRQRPLRIFGLFIAVASIAAQLAFWYAFVSVRCAFAAPAVARFSGSAG